MKEKKTNKMHIATSMRFVRSQKIESDKKTTERLGPGSESSLSLLGSYISKAFLCSKVYRILLYVIPRNIPSILSVFRTPSFAPTSLQHFLFLLLSSFYSFFRRSSLYFQATRVPPSFTALKPSHLIATPSATAMPLRCFFPLFSHFFLFF